MAGTLLFSVTADNRQHADDHLDARTSGGLIVVAEPKTHPWVASFGAYYLCSTRGRDITIQSVRYEASVQPLNVSFQLRNVDSGAAGIASARGEPPDFVDPDRHTYIPRPGTYEQLRPGRQITQTCADVADGKNGFTELLFVVTVGEQGGVINRAWIDYTVDGIEDHQYTLDLRWKMILCGNRVPANDSRGDCGPSAAPQGL
ncbi:hypothetical protein ACFOZ0_11145 [Streptomyces yaanensis]|uniref:Uncharacterized protein n=1 Tax=Streptomyces yaanensis TaxID=1142239 RepID=A0ABV7SBZ0_9ACTN|nr:hypothetical protein [Streptomyces sp. CGMCC 4.7035]WNB96890.1 hypothetical protein Q2K21_01725 [Streptomyces sp. CGMCC 4.7035]